MQLARGKTQESSSWRWGKKEKKSEKGMPGGVEKGAK